MNQIELQQYLQKKFPCSEITVYSFVTGPYGTVYTDTEELTYKLDAIGRAYRSRVRQLTPTEISVRKQPINTVIQLTGDSPYKGKYYCGTDGDGYLKLTGDINEAHQMREYTAEEVRSYVTFHSQYCYGKKFQTVKVA